MRIKLADRKLPDYTRGEEIFNMVTHIVGGGLSIAALVLCVIKSALAHSGYGVVSSAIYGAVWCCSIACPACTMACLLLPAKRSSRSWITAPSIL